VKRAYSFLVAVVATTVVLGGSSLYVVVVRERLPIEPALLHLSVQVLLAFLCLVVLRYFVLLWFSFLGHLETTHAEETGWAPLVSVIMPAYNEEKVIQPAMRSIAALDYPHLEIVVVDDGSRDRTYELATAAAAELTHVRVRVVTQRNGGKASALNHGISVASGDFVLCVDGDAVLAPRSLRVAVRHFLDPHVGAVAGNIKVVNRVNLITWMQALEYVQGLNMVRRAQAFFGIVNIVPGPLGLFRREAIRRVGGYPTDTFAEDCDLTLLLLEHGWRIRYEPEAVSLTEAPETVPTLLKQRYRWSRGMLQALRKRRRLLLRPGVDRATRGTLLYMYFESILWPFVNVVANVFLVAVALEYGMTRLMVLWWLQLTLLDVVGALFCVGMEREDFRLIPLAAVYRASFILLVDVCKLLSLLEELVGTSMSWGKLERLGRLT
jgi:biofilm PGA synthesis N-glycosyltransferase PgaC